MADTDKQYREYNKYNNYSHLVLVQLEAAINKMDPFHHIEILKRIAEHSGRGVINSSNSDCYINLTYLSDTTIDAIKDYADHATIQETYINETEQKKQMFRETLFAGV